jgi:hypothetical protein
MIRREGSKVIGPITSELIVRGLMAGKIPHDCMVQPHKPGAKDWTKILEVDEFHDAMQSTTVQPLARVSAAEAATTMMERPPEMEEEAGPTLPEEQLEALGRAWHAPEWMLILPGDKDMRGPYTLSEVKREIDEKKSDGAQVCRMRTFDWMLAQEAFDVAGEPPVMVPSSAKMKAAAIKVATVPPVYDEDPNRPVDWKAAVYRVMHAGELQGPTSLDQIERALQQGRLSRDDEISSDDVAAFLPLGPFLDDARKRKKDDRTVIVARKLGSEPAPASMGVRLPPGKWGTWVIVAAVVAGSIAVVMIVAKC